ncbi:hypothetical protein EDF56_10542 [Novosphingobium sp. PhB165]|uniref:hypothetical protein n=1 Tax=Novosphingobium sp. PhB165 TaxID=2485105 RepID=UPI00104ABAEC|nr:hypothetical protein [Novosphingobium sp. PhB165]TCM17700.1 hypothetical protein EDF56_10542 [Novosphingobium sp. PhB165]
MNTNTSPAKVRVLSSGIPAAEPARRRGDPGNTGGSDKGEQGASAPSVVANAKAGQDDNASPSLLWVAGAIVLFVIGSTVGGLFVTTSLLFPGIFQ